MSSGLTVLFHNVWGLTPPKLQHFQHIVINEPRTIIVLAETWFPVASRWTGQEYYRNSDFLAAESQRPIRNNRQATTGHENGGLLVLIHPEMKPHFQLQKKTEYSICFSIDNIHISGLYLPPRLTNHEVTNIFDELYHRTEVIIGDVNVRYGVAFKDTATNPQRRIVIDQAITKQGLQHLVPETLPCYTDHVFSNREMTLKYTPCAEIHHELHSDHGILHLEMDFSTPSSDPPIARYAYSALGSPEIQDAMRLQWADSDTHLTAIIQAAMNSTQGASRSAARLIIEEVYQVFTDELYHLCDSFLLKYNPRQVQITPDRTLTPPENASHTQVVRAFKRHQRHSGNPNVVKSRDENQSVMFECLAHYSTVFSERAQGFETDAEIPTFTPTRCSQNRFTAASIFQMIDRYPTSKSGGPDQLHAQLFRVLSKSPVFVMNLRDLFTLFNFTGITPRSWNSSDCVLLLKDQANPFATATRPISLTPTLRRYFEGILLRKFTEENVAWQKTSTIQHGFKKGFGVISQLINAHECSLLGYTSQTFLDLRSAYDRVPHAVLMNKLVMRGATERDRSLIHSLMIEDAQSYLIVNGIRSANAIRRKHGLYQGSLLAPLLFNVFIDDLVTQLTIPDNNGIVPNMAFADDIKVSAKTSAGNQALVTLCGEWAIRNGMIFNIRKCGTFPTRDPTEICIDNQPIPVVTSYKYLGAPHKRLGIDFVQHLEERTAKVDDFIRANQVKLRTWPPWARLHIWRTFGSSKLQYLYPLVQTFIARQDQQVKSRCVEIVESMRVKSLAFIYNIDSVKVKRNISILESLSGTLNPDHHSVLTRGRLKQHLESLDDTNQLHQLGRNANLAINPKSVIYHAWKGPPEFRHFRDEMREAIPSAQVKWKTWVKNQQLAAWHKEGKVLLNYIGKAQRTRGVGQDISFSRDRLISDDAIRWRRNLAFQGRLCTCGSRFNRAHVERCHLLEDDTLYQSYLIDPSLKNYAERLSALFLNHSYNPLDHALNKSKIEDFAHLYARIRTKLDGLQIIQDPP